MDPDHLPLILDVLVTNSLPVTAYLALAFGIVLLVCSAFVSASETAYFSLTPQDTEDLEQSRTRSAKMVLSLLENPQKLLATILIANNFINIVIIILFTHFTSRLFDFSQAPIWGFIVQTVIITFLLLLFGEIMPKVYATQSAKKVACFASTSLYALEIILSPAAKLLVKSTSVVQTQIDKHAHKNISMDELSQALKLTSDSRDDDKEMLEGIIKFGNIQVSDIMCSRLDMVDVDIKSNYKELLQVIIDSGYSRIPVYASTRDKIKGLIYSKDLIPHLDKPANFRWQTLIRPAYFVPESKKIDDLLHEFQENKVHLAIVVDEYGGTSGLVTMEDILEEIVGDISDEYDDDEKLYTKIDNNTYIFEGKILLNDFYKITDIDNSELEKIAEEVETLAGLVLEIKGEMPKRNEQITYGKYSFEILSVDKYRIKTIKFRIKTPIAAPK